RAERGAVASAAAVCVAGRPRPSGAARVRGVASRARRAAAFGAPPGDRPPPGTDEWLATGNGSRRVRDPRSGPSDEPSVLHDPVAEESLCRVSWFLPPCYLRLWDIAWRISRWASAFLSASRLSWNCLPCATASSTLARPRLKYSR